jgi:CMP/dCMP kinase
MKILRENLIVTIDGPAGSGKSTIAKGLASRLNGKRVDTGAIYRSFAWFIIDQKVDQTDHEMLNKKGYEMELLMEHNGTITLNSTDITNLIRTPHIGQMASKLAAIPRVREALLDLQRDQALPGPTVFEGRDMGSVVFPNCSAKFFLTASAKERAMRRYLELKEKGKEIPYESILKEQIERDERDTTRATAPLKPAHDAIKVDSTKMTIDQVVDFMHKHISTILSN